MKTLLVLLLLSLFGCMNITAQTMPENPDVKAAHEDSDCVPIIFGFSWGTATVEKARHWIAEESFMQIKRIRSVAIHDYMFLYFGARCVEVVGE